MKGNRTAGRFSALLTIIIWGTTFISTKILLADFPPVQILCFRFAMGLLALLIVYPRRLKGTNRHQELTFAAAACVGYAFTICWKIARSLTQWPPMSG